MRLMTVNESANILQIPPDTIRRWEKKGLIRAKKSSKNHRLFDIEEIKRVANKYKPELVGSENKYKIHQNPKTNYSTIELFSGAGGLALGLENAGFESKLLVEIDKDCVKTLKLNRPNWNVIGDDIRKVDFTEYNGKIDVVAGGFPCQSFSYAGLSRGFEDTRGTLFFEFARCVNEVKPKILLAENVRGLVTHDNGKTLETMLKALNEIGYNVSYKVLKAQFFDVPQKRERIVIIGVRKDLKIKTYFPKEKDYIVTIREALTNCPESLGTKYPPRKKEILDLVPEGGYWRDLPINIQKEYMAGSFHLTGGKTGMARRLAWDEPSLTLTCAPAQKQTERCHPKETRPLNIREYARIQTFIDEWEFVGSIASQYKQIGNAVPVNLAYYVGSCLIKMLEGNIDEDIEEEVKENIMQLSLAFN